MSEMTYGLKNLVRASANVAKIFVTKCRANVDFSTTNFHRQ